MRNHVQKEIQNDQTFQSNLLVSSSLHHNNFVAILLVRMREIQREPSYMEDGG